MHKKIFTYLNNNKKKESNKKKKIKICQFNTLNKLKNKKELLLKKDEFNSKKSK